MNHKAHFKGDIQVDGDIIDSDGQSVGGGLVIGDWVFRTDVAAIHAAGGDAYLEIIPNVTDKPYEAQAEFSSSGGAVSSISIHSYPGNYATWGLVIPELAGVPISVNLILKPNESYYLLWDAADITIPLIRERPLS